MGHFRQGTEAIFGAKMEPYIPQLVPDKSPESVSGSTVRPDYMGFSEFMPERSDLSNGTTILLCSPLLSREE